MAKQINVVAAVVIDGAKLLAGRREGGRLGEGFWELPGGRLNPGEDPRQTLMCELKEELGVASYIGERVVPTVVHTYDRGEVHMQVFYAGLKGNTLTAVAHDAFRWGTPQELADLNWLGAAKPVIARLQGMDLTKVAFPGRRDGLHPHRSVLRDRPDGDHPPLQLRPLDGGGPDPLPSGDRLGLRQD